MKRMDIRRTDELREEIGVQMSLMGRLVKCRLRWAQHLVWIGKERMAKRANRLREEGKRKRGRTWLKWENCVMIDILKVGVVGEWRVLTEDRGRWRSIVVKAVQKIDAMDLTPYKGKRRRTTTTSML